MNSYSVSGRAQAFTLIELLVVIAIIGILSSLSVVSFGASRQRARNSKAKNDITAGMKAVESFKLAGDNQIITASVRTANTLFTGLHGTVIHYQWAFNGNEVIATSSPSYAASIKKSPTNTMLYKYCTEQSLLYTLPVTLTTTSNRYRLFATNLTNDAVPAATTFLVEDGVIRDMVNPSSFNCTSW